ncbi:MAG: FkbM family methyltransferase [Pseudomonadota bacterium]
MTGLDLPLRRRLHLAAHNLGAQLGVKGLKTVCVRRDGDHFIITTEGHDVAVAAALRWMMYRRGWENRLHRLSWQFGVGDRVQVGAGATVIDIGANVGEFSLRQAANGARVFAVEGDPRVFACLSRNVAGHPGITPIPALLWKEETDLTFYSEPNKADSSVFRPDSAEAVQTITLPATTLDRLAEVHGIDRVDFLKCDAEGAEPEVIEGGRNLLMRTRQVAFDTGAERLGQETAADVERLLTGLGFTVTHETRRRRKITFGHRAA